jgi:hypothetical protein
MALQLLALASAAHITAPTSTTRIHLISIMFSETFFPMAAANSVPRTVRKYHYEHAPPPSSSVELTAELHRNLRAVPHGGFWGKVKSVGWRLLRESFIYLIYTRPTTLTTFLESNSRAAPSSPFGARTSRSRPRRVPPPALANSPQTFTSTQWDVRTSCLVRPGPRRTGSFTFLLAHLACQDVAKRGCRLFRASSQPLLVYQRVQSRRSRAAHGRTTPPHRPQPHLPCLRPRPRLHRQQTPI